MVRDRGFEPLTPSVSRKCSTTELTAHERPNKLAETNRRCKFVYFIYAENPASVAFSFR